MPAKLSVIAGPPRSGKTERLLIEYRRAVAADPPGSAVWLAPTWRAVAAVRQRLLAGLGAGCFGPGVMTFERFAEAVLQAAPAAVRPVSRLMKRTLVRRLIDEQLAAGRLKHFAPIAQTGGLVDLVCEFIRELKRLEIWPEQFEQACRRRGITQKDVELFELYDAYQQCLREHQLYDAEGRFWSARALLRDGQRRPWQRLRLVAADGFTDFTRTQHEILEILAGRVAQMFITLPLEGGSATESPPTTPQRGDLFSKPLATLAELRRRHRQVQIEQLPRATMPDWPAMAHVERTLFANPRRRQPADDARGIEILAAARQLGEIELIGSRIKHLLSDGVRPGQIAVVFRAPQDAAELVREVFGSLGIPFAIETGRTPDRSPALRGLVSLLQLDVDDWPFDGLLSLLGNNYFQPGWPEWHGQTAMAAEGMVRKLQIPRGRRPLLDQLTKPRPAGAKDGRDQLIKPRPAVATNGRDHRSRLYEEVAAVFGRLAAAYDELPQTATLAEWAAAWQQLAAETGLLGVIERGEGGTQADLPDRLAWKRVMAALDEGDTLGRWTKRSAPRLDRREALAALRDVLASERLGSGGDESGRVRVLSAPSIRALQVPYLFVAGLAEKAFPPPERDEGLYSEAENARLIEEGLPLVARTQRSRDEMLLFYETITRATRRLTLSYPAMDDAAGPLSPSPYLMEVEQACGAGRIRRIELADLTPVPTGDEPLCDGEFRLKAVATALGGNVSLLAGLMRHDPAVAENLLAALSIVEQRSRREDFSAAEGILSGDAAAERLAAEFSLSRTFGATELEQYAACPFRFFLERVLKLGPLEDLTLAVDVLQRGRLAHAVLAAFHRRVNTALGRPASPGELDDDEFDRLMRETLDEQLADEPAAALSAALREVDRHVLRRWTAAYREQHRRYDAKGRQCDEPPVPEFFEVSFGKAATDEPPPSTERPLEFPADGGTVRISGRIDRIDSGKVATTNVYNVLDYKTGGSQRLSVASVADGTTLQLPLYAVAAAELLLEDRNPVPWQAGYWYLRDRGFQPFAMYRREGDGVAPEPAWEEMRVQLGATVVALVKGIRRGEFPVHSADERCTGYCPFGTVCRINQVRSLEKQWHP